MSCHLTSPHTLSLSLSLSLSLAFCLLQLVPYLRNLHDMYALGVLYAVRFPVCFQINLMFLDANDDDSDQSGGSFMHFLGLRYSLLSSSSCIIFV
jgi:hypothetical protein